MATGGFVLSPEQQQQFDEWILDGNAHKNQSGKWTEQTTQWKKEFTLPELKTFFFKEFLADQYNDGHLVVGAKANSYISSSSRYKDGDSVNNPELAQEIFNSGDTWGWDFYDKFGNQIDEDGQYMKQGGKAGKVSRPMKVRFHLGAGKNFMTWRVEDIRTKHVQFIDPESNRIVMYDCKLTNRPTTAKKIFSGAINKQPIAWIECIKVEVFQDTEIPVAIDQIRYNPRENINWSNNTSKNIDGEVFPKLVTYGRSVFVQSGDKYYELGGVLAGKGHGVDFDSVGTEPFSSVQTNLKNGGSVGTSKLYTFKNDFRSDTRVLIKESPSNQKSIVSITVRKWSEKHGKPIIDIDKTLYLTSEEVKELLVKINKKNPKLIIF
jgi:hypothetical protein